MANKIVLKKSSVATKVPLATDLDIGELAVNLADAKLYTKNAGGTVIQLGGGSGSGDVVGPASATDNAVARFNSTTGKLIQNSVMTVDDAGNTTGTLSQQFSDGTAVTVAAGKFWYNGSNGSWNMGMGGGNITQQVGEELFRYGQASAAITDSPLQLVYKTGVVGGSGVITFAPAVAGITDGDNILGCATESIATNAFGRITTYGIINNITTNGSAYGETWADNDDIYYNPITGGLTKTIPAAPGLKILIGTVITAGSGGSGKFIVKLGVSTSLSELSDVQITSLASGNTLIYDAAQARWENASLTQGTGITVTNGAGSITVANDGVTSLAGTANQVSASASTGAVTLSLPSTINVNTTGTASNVTGTVAVANGGTNGTATPASGAVAYGTGTAYAFTSAGTAGQVLTSNGSSAPTWATPSSGITTAGNNTFTGIQTFAGTSSNLAVVLTDAAEVTTISATAATGTINYDITTQSVLYYTSNASANWTVNFRGSSGTSLNTLMTTGQSITVAFLVTQGGTAYYNNVVQVDGSAVTPKWQGGTAPTTGNASSIDAYSYTIVKTGSAAFTIFASQNKFA